MTMFPRTSRPTRESGYEHCGRTASRAGPSGILPYPRERRHPRSAFEAADGRATASHRGTPALLPLLAGPDRPSGPFVWDQTEADRLLARLREALARVEAARAAWP